MTDRELLEAAAKAAGLGDGEWHSMAGWGEVRYGLSSAIWTGEEYWNPLERNDEAFRLAVDLRIDIWFLGQNTVQVAGGEHQITSEAICIESDPRAATRRAIVRAAAEMAPAHGMPGRAERFGMEEEVGDVHIDPFRDVIRQMTLPPRKGTPAADLTERERLTVCIAAGAPTESVMDGLRLTVRTTVPCGVADRGDGGYIVTIGKA